MNNLKTTIFIGFLTGLIMGIGFWLGGQSWMVFALLVSFVMNMGAYWWSDKIVLKTYGAIPAKKRLFGDL